MRTVIRKVRDATPVYRSQLGGTGRMLCRNLFLPKGYEWLALGSTNSLLFPAPQHKDHLKGQISLSQVNYPVLAPPSGTLMPWGLTKDPFTLQCWSCHTSQGISHTLLPLSEK